MDLVKVKHIWLGGQPGTKEITLVVKGDVEPLNDVNVGVQDGKKYSVEVKRVRKRRSLSANGYAWVLIGKLADKLGAYKDDIYRAAVKMYGCYEVIRVVSEAAEKFKSAWSMRGLGWTAESLGTVGECTDLMCMYGTSVYNTREMGRFIDGLVEECKAQGIETMPPDELAALLSDWERGKSA